MVIGVAGKACAGKDMVVSWLKERQWQVIDADALGQQVLRDKEDEVVALFTEYDILDHAGGLDRKKLGALVFGNKKKLQILNNFSHPHIVERIHQAISTYDGHNIAINAALLPLVKVEGVHAMLWVQAPLSLRIKRALHRDRRSMSFVLKRIWMQRKLKPQLFWKNVDIYTIDNDKTKVELHEQLLTILTKIKG